MNRPRDRTWPFVLSKSGPSGLDPEYQHLLFVAVFFNGQCHFLKGWQFIEILRELDELNSHSCLREISATRQIVAHRRG